MRYLDGLDSPHALREASGTWTGDSDVRVTTRPAQGELVISISAPRTQLTHVHLRWKSPAPATLRVLGDAWERSYGNLGWREMIPERALPWYFLTLEGNRLHGYGVKTGARSLAFWLRDNEGVSLWLDVRNGGDGVQLGERTLEAATVVTRESREGDEPFAAARAFCKQMCPSPRLLQAPIVGSNDWYYAYGKNTPEGILRDASLVAELAPSGVKPFAVIDDGYQDPARFPSLPGLAQQIRAKGARPGIWIRPLRAPADEKSTLLLPAARFGHGQDSPAYDPTIPEARELILKTVSDAAHWGYELIKHDFSTYELLGQWGSSMDASPTRPGWSLHDRSQTNAEIVLDLYRGIREKAGDRLVLSCNAIGHLGAGIFEMQRTGDDVSGRIWERTRRTGVNTLAFRLPQNHTFFTNDADCVAFTPEIPWQFTRQWLDAVAASGTLLLISPDPKAIGPEQKEAIRRAFALSADGQTASTPLDWTETHTPEHWSKPPGESTYHWLPPEGANPFQV